MGPEQDGSRGRAAARVGAIAGQLASAARTRGRQLRSGLGDRARATVQRLWAGPEPTDRLLSIDVLRGVLIAAVVVLDPLSGSRDHPHLAHAAWDGYTVTDLVLPALLVVSGVGLAFLLRGPIDRHAVRRILRRTVALLLLGIVVYNQLGDLNLAEARFSGVLQMFAVSGLLAAMVVAALRVIGRGDRWWLGLVVVAIGTIVYQQVFLDARAALVCAHPEGWCSPFHALDVRLLGADHVYRLGRGTWDPEGVVPSVAATVLVLAGWTIGAAIRQHRTVEERRPWILPAGLIVVGVLLLGLVTPALAATLEVNKRLHTPAFQSLTIGYVALALAGLFFLFDQRVPTRAHAAVGWSRRAVAWPLETLGRNPLTVYILAHVVAAGLATNQHPTAGTWRERFSDWTVSVAGGPLWGDPVFNEVFGLLAMMFAVAVVMRLLGWRVSL